VVQQAGCYWPDRPVPGLDFQIVRAPDAHLQRAQDQHDLVARPFRGRTEGALQLIGLPDLDPVADSGSPVSRLRCLAAPKPEGAGLIRYHPVR
jgi:hypothetical protein